MKKYDVIVVGGGASGSVCAIMLAKQGKSVCVVDSAVSVAKKLLVTGNGRCNITNKNMSAEFYNQDIGNFLNNFGCENTIDFFEGLGLPIYADEEGRCYPISNSAKSVVFVLQKAFEKLGVDFVGGQTVNKIEKYCNQENKSGLSVESCPRKNANDSLNFVVKTENDEFCSKNLVVACGCNQNILNLLKNFGVLQKPLVPSLVALKTVQNTKRLEGIRLSGVKVTAQCGKIKKTQFGEILFKNSGLSGICVFNLSTIFARQNSFVGKLIVDIFPNISKEKLASEISKNAQIFTSTSEMLLGMLHKELAFEVLKRAGINSEDLCKRLMTTQIDKIADIIKNFEFDVCGYYDNNQVYCGGVELESLTQNLESKTTKKLYFCGEICNVDGECGGYNLQWAFSSASAVATAINSHK